MMVSRLPFAIDDLEIALRALGCEPEITIRLDAKSYELARGVLSSHYSQQKIFSADGDWFGNGNIVIERRQEKYGHPEYGIDAKAGRLTTKE